MIDLKKEIAVQAEGQPLVVKHPVEEIEGTVYIRPTEGNIAYSVALEGLLQPARDARLRAADLESLAEAQSVVRGKAGMTGEELVSDGKAQTALWMLEQLTSLPESVKAEARRKAYPGTVLVGWEDDSFGIPSHPGGNLDREAASQLLSVDWIFQQVDKAAQGTDPFLQALERVLKEKAESPLAGSSSGGARSKSSSTTPARRKRSTRSRSKKPAAKRASPKKPDAAS